VTLSDRLLIVTDGDQRHEEMLAGDAEILAAYRDRFGIVLDRVPEVLSPLPE
jgi:N-hydroxyarylamine O-acetyltransferase